MAKRVKRKAKKKTARKASRRKAAPKRKVAKKKSSRSKGAAQKSLAVNKKAQWNAYRSLQSKVDKAYEKLKSDVKKKAAPKILIRDKNQLLLLLGECNYMARECVRMSSSGKKR